MPRYIGDFELDGQQIVERFETYLLTGQLTSTAQFRNVAQTGPPTFGIRDITSGIGIINGLTVDLDTPIQGQHRMLVDFTSANLFQVNRTYELIVLDGSINADAQGGWVNVVGQSVMTWGSQLRSEGQLLQRIIKLAEFTVESSTDGRNFVVSVPNVSSPTPNYFENQNVVWDEGTSNFGIGRAVRSSTDAGGGNVALEMMDPFPNTPQQGQTGVFLPEERPSEKYWANIKSEYGGPDTYTVEWFKGTQQIDPTESSGSCRLTVTRGSTDSTIINNAIMTDSVSQPGWYRFVESSNLIAPNDIARIETQLTINGALRTWSRSLAYQV